MTTATIYLTPDFRANEYLITSPLALVIGMLLDQQIPMERAFAGPKELANRIGFDLDAERISELDPEIVIAAFSKSPALHRFPRAMAERTQLLCTIIAKDYSNKADQVWDPTLGAEVVLKNLRKLPGFGEQKAKIFLALLAKRFLVAPAGWQYLTSPFGEEGSFVSVADIDSQDALDKVRAHKAEIKAANKAKGTH